MAYLLKQPIVIADYDPNWSVLYQEESQHLKELLLPIVIQIEHIGSTSVPGLGAKPIVDISASVKALDEVTPFVEKLEKYGYKDARIHPQFQRRLFCKGDYNEGSHHLHFTIHGSPIWEEPILFRNYLRCHLEDAAWYHRIKLDCAAKYQRDLDGYHGAKSECVSELMHRARLWLAEVNERNKKISTGAR